MLSSLDPHSSYLNEKSFADMQVTTKGEFGGLGLEVTQQDGVIKVMSPIDDTPAARAGIQPGDFITHIDSEAVLGLSINDAVNKMRGAAGSKITLTIRRASEKEPLKLVLTREVIKIQSVRAKSIDGMLYVRITSFSDNTNSGLLAAIDKAKKAFGHTPRGIILDLRNNPGGLLDQAVAVSDAFLETGEIVSTRGRNDKDVQRFSAQKGEVSQGVPIVVLINGGSASASEIVAGALQDHKRAVVVGTKSFGKGSVQMVVPLGDGKGAIRMTTSRYFTPSGRSIQARGIDPDIVVQQGKFQPADSASADQLTENSLAGHLVNPQDKEKAAAEAEAKARADANKNKAKPANDNNGLTPFTDKELEDDYQLTYATQLLRGVVVATDPQAPRGTKTEEPAKPAEAPKPDAAKPAPKPATPPAPKPEPKAEPKPAPAPKTPAVIKPNENITPNNAPALTPAQ
jgi:carboxyl-terminal processing protease